MLGLPGVNPVPLPMDLGASVGDHHAAGGIYLFAAVVLPLLLFMLISLRVLSAPARWARWGHPEAGGWAWRVPYEVFVVAAPVSATVAAEWLAITTVASGDSQSAVTNRLLVAGVAGLIVMGVSGVRSLGGRPLGKPIDS